MKFIGIDISKNTFDVALLVDNKIKNHCFKNQLIGYKSLLKWVKGDAACTVFCLEATGIYSVGLAKFLHDNGLCILMVNPIKTHAFAKIEMLRNKTDKADAELIARFTHFV